MLTTYIFYWLLAAVPSFFHEYCNGADLNFRLKKAPDLDVGIWKFHREFYCEGFVLFLHDFFGVYCPWSWERAKQFRLADMRKFLGEHGATHATLGHITEKDCDRPEMQERIARESYISRTAHWSKFVVQFLFSPIFGMITLVILAIILVVDGTKLIFSRLLRS